MTIALRDAPSGPAQTKYDTHPAKPGIIPPPRHRTLSPGVARTVAKAAGWIE